MIYALKVPQIALLQQVVTPALMTGAAVLALHRLLLELQQHIRQSPFEGAPSLVVITVGESCHSLPVLK